MSKGCETGKVCYPRAGDARVALGNIVRRRHSITRTAGPLKAYECRLCGSWHIGSSKPRGSR